MLSSACRKASQSFAPAGANRVLIIFSGDMCVGENTLGSQTCERSECAAASRSLFQTRPNAVEVSFESLSKILFDKLKKTVQVLNCNALFLHVLLLDRFAVVENAGAVKEEHVVRLREIHEPPGQGGRHIPDVHDRDFGIALREQRAMLLPNESRKITSSRSVSALGFSIVSSAFVPPRNISYPSRPAAR